MPHVQHFKANFAQADVVNTGTDGSIDHTVDRAELYDTDSQVRNVCFVWEDGRKAFFNYAYLLSVDLLTEGKLNVMLLYFSGQIVTVKGYRLGLLFDLLLGHSPKTIVASHPRYYVAEQTEASFVTDIVVKSE